MLCPFCGAEMEAGVLQGGGGHAISWMKKPSVYPNVFNMEALGEHTWKYSYVPAARCTVCRKILLSY